MKKEIENAKRYLYNAKDKAIIGTIEIGLKALDFTAANPDGLTAVNNMYNAAEKILSIPTKMGLYSTVKNKINNIGLNKKDNDGSKENN